jgi:hypothetical protein
MPPRLEQYERWIGDYLNPRYPALVAPLLEALEAFDAAMESGVLTDEQLRLVVDCAQSPRTPLGENIATLLGELAERFTAAELAVREMAVHTKVHVRVNALVAISSSTPAKLHTDVLRIALKDRSSRVRTLAADKIMQFRLDHLLPDLEEVIARENVTKIREELEFSRDLLRDGYHVRPFDDAHVWLSFRMPAGGGTKSVSVSADDLREKGAKAIAKSIGAEVSD